jgi:hypothetical protein
MVPRRPPSTSRTCSAYIACLWQTEESDTILLMSAAETVDALSYNSLIESLGEQWNSLSSDEREMLLATLLGVKLDVVEERIGRSRLGGDWVELPLRNPEKQEFAEGASWGAYAPALQSLQLIAVIDLTEACELPGYPSEFPAAGGRLVVFYSPDDYNFAADMKSNELVTYLVGDDEPTARFTAPESVECLPETFLQARSDVADVLAEILSAEEDRESINRDLVWDIARCDGHRLGGFPPAVQNDVIFQNLFYTTFKELYELILSQERQDYYTMSFAAQRAGKPLPPYPRSSTKNRALNGLYEEIDRQA